MHNAKTLTFEKTVTADHKLHIDLPNNIIGKVKVTITPANISAPAGNSKLHDYLAFLQSMPRAANKMNIDAAVKHVRQLREEWD